MQRFALGILLLVLVAAAAGCGSDAEKKQGAAYVALGDSYTAAPGILPVADARCARSDRNYPALVAKALKVSEFSDRSCSAATTKDLEVAQTLKYQRLNDPQLNAIEKDTGLVTVGIGLNDDGITTGLFLVCLSPDHEQSAACTQYLELPQSTIEAAIKKAADNVATALETIARKAPRAQIVLVGYPRIVPDSGSCPDRFPVPEAQLTRLRDAMRFANDAWRQAAEQAGASYVDMYTPSEGHDICSDDPWISGYTGVPGKSAALHPFESYEKAVADRIVKLVEED